MAMPPTEPSVGASPRRTLIEAHHATGARPADGTDARAGTPERSLDDLAVARAVLEGDRDAFRVLVDRESSSVVRACFRVLGDLHEAEDCAQEAFVSAYRSLATWRGEGPFGAWVTRIAVRLAVRQLGKRRAVAWVRPTAPDGTLDERVAALPSSSATQPENVAIRTERLHATRRAVADLDEPYRETVALRFFGERSLEEIAATTGRPLNTVKTHLRRGLLQLRDRVERGGAS